MTLTRCKFIGSGLPAVSVVSCSAAMAAGTAFIEHDTDGISPDMSSNLAAHLTTAGYTTASGTEGVAR